MDNRHILSLLGLALRGGNLQVGEEPAGDAIQAHSARVVLLAADAAENTRRRIERSAQRENSLCLVTPFTKEELGQALGRGSAAVAAVTDTGLAAAAVRRLAEQDPDRYQEASALLEKRNRRLAERRAGGRVREKKREKAPAPRREARKRNKPAGRPRRSQPGGPSRNGGGGPDFRGAAGRPAKKGKGRKREA